MRVCIQYAFFLKNSFFSFHLSFSCKLFLTPRSLFSLDLILHYRRQDRPEKKPDGRRPRRRQNRRPKRRENRWRRRRRRDRRHRRLPRCVTNLALRSICFCFIRQPQFFLHMHHLILGFFLSFTSLIPLFSCADCAGYQRKAVNVNEEEGDSSILLVDGI